MIKKLSLSMSIFLLLLLFTSSYALAAGPLSEVYTNPLDGISTNANIITDDLNTLGYDAYGYPNSNAYYVRRTMNKDAIFFVAAHGQEGGGRVRFRNSSGTFTYLSDKSISSDNSNYSLQALYGTNSSALTSIRLAYYSACQSSRTSSTYGNLVQKTRDLGALCSVGFYYDIGNAEAAYFEQVFFLYAYNGFDVLTSLNNAVQDTISEFGAAANLNSYSVSFSSRAGATVYLVPSLYGY